MQTKADQAEIDRGHAAQHPSPVTDGEKAFSSWHVQHGLMNPHLHVTASRLDEDGYFDACRQLCPDAAAKSDRAAVAAYLAETASKDQVQA